MVFVEMLKRSWHPASWLIPPLSAATVKIMRWCRMVGLKIALRMCHCDEWMGVDINQDERRCELRILEFGDGSNIRTLLSPGERNLRLWKVTASVFISGWNTTTTPQGQLPGMWAHVGVFARKVLFGFRAVCTRTPAVPAGLPWWI